VLGCLDFGRHVGEREMNALELAIGLRIAAGSSCSGDILQRAFG